ncbi:MAG: tRNA (N(6)-L-threonylcarbamoyladenosine(37)-C(2))-methylthiotransferase MtaB [Muribaculaceae bacterium]|nr:tRNA (N(6)-L-threonylcarbamoyladenosine(37)-C(2))-methylthiotransferase MtaB [Muribaculaceae bacterium]
MTPDLTPRKAAYFTLGCKLNFAETSTIGKILADKGFRRALPDETPDICVVNTCSVTEMADKKDRSLIRRLVRKWPEATIVVTGCYAQLKPEEAASIEGVDIVLGSNEKLRIAQYIDDWESRREKIMESTSSPDITTFLPSCERGDRTRFWLKVQDGCDYYCTYCTIPFARGRSRSGRISDLVDQARDVARQGGKEIVLTGVNVGCFGLDTGEDFFDLLRQLDAVEGIERYRISSIEPNLLTPEIIRWIASEARAFMPSFHIPLQSGSDKVLKLMNRRYSTDLFQSRIRLIREMMPDAFIGVDIIAGARGESDEEWQKSLDFVKGLPISRLHVFPYSERPGTAALRLNAESVDPGERHRRGAELQKVSDEKLGEYMKKMIGQTRKVLWEHLLHDDPSRMSGLTDNYVRVVAPAKTEWINEVTQVKIIGIDAERAETLIAAHLDEGLN